MNKYLTLIISIALWVAAYGQSYNQQNTALRNFLVRMYEAEPFEGVRIVTDYDCDYLLSVVLLEKNGQASEPSRNRIAQVKNSRQVSQYLGALTVVDSETLIKISEDVPNSKTIEEITDIIKERSVGYTKAMEVLAVIDKDEDTICYMFICKLDDLKELRQ